jgi:ATPase subunit of ABC transporter with duplicated ATPase domains
VKNGRVTWYPGDYDYFLHKKAQEEGEEAELFRSEERIEAHHPRLPRSAEYAPEPTSPSSPDGAAGGTPRKSKEQKRMEAEERQARYRREQEEKRKQEVITRLKESEDLILSEMGRPATHENPQHVADLSRRLGEIQKQIKTLGGTT